MKTLIALENNAEAQLLQTGLESINYRVRVCHEAIGATRHLLDWQPDVLVTEEKLQRGESNSGLRLAELCRLSAEQSHGCSRTQALILVPFADWDRIERAQRTGAHVIVKASNFDAVIRYIQTVVDDLITDRMLGPTLVGIHCFTGNNPRPNCENCQWVGADIAYGRSKTDVRNLTAVRIALLNALLFRRRGQRANEIEDACRESPFLKKLLRKHVLRQSAVKMEVARLRKHFDDELTVLGMPYTGKYFLPYVTHGAETYRLSGSRRLAHIPVAASWPELSDTSCGDTIHRVHDF